MAPFGLWLLAFWCSFGRGTPSSAAAAASSSSPSAASSSSDFELTILHVNDFHARFEETNVHSGRCSDRDRLASACFGGFARLQTAVRREMAANPNTIFLSAGDYFQGTVWYTVHRWRALAQVLNLIHHDAMCLGNHEFDDGVSGLAPFLAAVKFPVLASNVDAASEPTLSGRIRKSVVLTREGRKIGVVGYLTTETKEISHPGRLSILDEEASVRREAKRLKEEEGVAIVVALGHAGFRKDMSVAANVEGVDVVVGGHTNTFLYTGESPSTEAKVGDYPSVAVQADGRKVPVVQAFAFGKYLGKLTLTFDERGEVTKWEGNPILLDSTIPKDPEMEEELRPLRQEIADVMGREVGRTLVFLDGKRENCRLRECNLGNLETDAIIHANAKYPDDDGWATTSLAVLNSGGIRSSVDERASNGSMTMEDILAFAPFQNTIDIVELRGKHVREMFEHSVASYDVEGLAPPGAFLQVSGFSVTYDLSRDPGRRVRALRARCRECRVPEMAEVEDEAVYRVAMPAFLAEGGDGFGVVGRTKLRHRLTGLLDSDVYMEYIAQMSPIYQGVEGRILFVDSSNASSSSCTPTRDAHAHREEPTPTPFHSGAAPKDYFVALILGLMLVLL